MKRIAHKTPVPGFEVLSRCALETVLGNRIKALAACAAARCSRCRQRWAVLSFGSAEPGTGINLARPGWRLFVRRARLGRIPRSFPSPAALTIRNKIPMNLLRDSSFRSCEIAILALKTQVLWRNRRFGLGC
ncbi:hypothetical protein AV530_001524 [Patagioenas fasciata monilis]|uniref:Uncharacterized protein n=1 Tax=Patagioenas fasciata monilis TaxID=372326 RepID=A0A1V4KR14_PATFA|nr:hypothetical protein AV530_001524 [Patagioenas fasciata monilis]